MKRAACRITKGTYGLSRLHVTRPSFASSLRLMRALRSRGWRETPAFGGGRGSKQFENNQGHYYKILYPLR